MLIMLTQRCNLHCRHCLGRHNANGEDMSFDTFREAFHHLGCLDPNIILTGGEPFLNEDLPKIVEWLLQPSISCFGLNQLIITTNGTLIYTHSYRNWVKKMLKKASPKFRIQVSNDPEYYDVKLNLRLLTAMGVETVSKLHGIMPLGRAADNHLPTYGYKAAYCVNPIMMANQLTNFEDVNKALAKMKWACGFMVMPNLDIYLAECRKIRLANLAEDDWKEKCWRRLTIEKPYQKGGILCDECGFSNQRAFELLR